jgi:RNA polymerase sigma-70 factor (ECF subfamily)
VTTVASAPHSAPAPLPADDLVRRHLRSLWRYLRMLGADAAEADDLAQEAFVVAMQKGLLQAGLGEPGSVAAFLRTTARFLFLRLRKAGRRQRRLADEVDALWARDAARDGGDALVAAVRACVGELDGRARRAIELCYGLHDNDAQGRAAIAHELGLQENGVKTLLQRVRHRLRECIERRKER